MYDQLVNTQQESDNSYFRINALNKLLWRVDL